MKEILDQIQQDLCDLQNNPNELSMDSFMLFYDRMRANITDYENLPAFN